MGDLDYLFGPISHKYCIYFYILSVVGFVYFAAFLIVGLYIGLFTKPVKGFKYYISFIMGLSIFFFFYFQNRLLYTMCNNSI